LAYNKTKVQSGSFKSKDIITFNIYQLAANLVAWVIVAPVLDILIYAEPVTLVFTQGIVAALMNTLSAGIFGSLLLIAYARTRTQASSLE
jgi:energy-coupling factor transport system substrate-specific component